MAWHGGPLACQLCMRDSGAEGWMVAPHCLAGAAVVWQSTMRVSGLASTGTTAAAFRGPLHTAALQRTVRLSLGFSPCCAMVCVVLLRVRTRSYTCAGCNAVLLKRFAAERTWSVLPTHSLFAAERT
jgi:hypothetical protein